MIWRQLRLHATVSLIALSLWHCLIKCLLYELVPPLSYFFLVLCSLAPRNLKRSLNVFWCQVLGLGLVAQVIVNNTDCCALYTLHCWSQFCDVIISSGVWLMGHTGRQSECIDQESPWLWRNTQWVWSCWLAHSHCSRIATSAFQVCCCSHSRIYCDRMSYIVELLSCSINI